MPSARLIKVRGVVQGVGFRPFVYRIASELHVTGWVLNGEEGVAIHAEGDDSILEEFLRRLKTEAPPAARIVEIEVSPVPSGDFQEFSIKESERNSRPTVRISP